jgi:hypothetical protein
MYITLSYISIEFTKDFLTNTINTNANFATVR